jgi:phosphorylase/glycogen(starch) synthase
MSPFVSQSHSLFEVSFEICNKVGGIYTVLSTKARTLVERFGDDYVCVGPWLLRDDEQRPTPFEKEPGFEAFEDGCRAAGLPVQVGRWSIPGRPRAVLVEFSSLYEQKDGVLAGLWERFAVDSIQGAWDYVEPVLFGHAAGQVIERWWEEYLAPQRRRAVAQFHEWMTGAGLLHLKTQCPGIGTVFTTHATMLGRALSSLGRSPEDGLAGDTPEDLAAAHGVTAKHSLEGVCAREADVFTTVSEITAAEAELLHRRRPQPILANGIDQEVIDALAGATGREEARERLRWLATTFLGEDIADAALVAISGRYEFHNKGLDLLLDAAADVAGRAGRRIVIFILVPAGSSGLRAVVRERIGARRDTGNGDPDALGEPLGISTHNLFDAASDPVQQRCRELGLANERGSRVKVVQIPIYLSEHDDCLQLPYEAVLRAMDFTCFPSYYEPWGYTPQESLAVGVPTITTDYAGFGRWALAEGLDSADGITVIARARRTYAEVRRELGDTLEAFLREMPGGESMAAACRASAARTAWADLVRNYDEAFALALAAIQERLRQGIPFLRRPKQPLPVVGESRAPRLTRFDVSATLPDALAPLAEVARNYAWCWDPEGRALFAELSPESWRAAGHNPTVFLRQVFRKDIEARAADAAYVARVARVASRLATPAPDAPDAPDGRAIALDLRGAPGGLLLRRVRDPRVAAHLLGRARGPVGRPPEVRERRRAAARRRRALLRPRLHDAALHVGRRPGRARRDQRAARPGARGRVRRGRRAARAPPAHARPRVPPARLARARRSRPALPARLERRVQPVRGPRHHAEPVRRRRDDAHPPGARARPRRCAPAAAPRHRARRVAHERGARRVPQPRAGRAADPRRGADLRGGARGRARDDGVHDAHAGARGSRPVLGGPDAHVLLRRGGLARRAVGTLLGARAGPRRQ